MIFLYIIGTVVAFLFLCAFVAWLFTPCMVPREKMTAGPEEDWRGRYGNEQRRFDQMRSLFERLRVIDDHSPAARNIELRAIEAEYRALCPPMPTRRSEP